MNVVPARSVTSLVVILNYSKLSYSEHVFSLTSLTPILQIVFETCHPCPRWWSKTCSGGWGCWRSSRSLQSRGTAEMTMSGKVFFEKTSLKKEQNILWNKNLSWRGSGCGVKVQRLRRGGQQVGAHLQPKQVGERFWVAEHCQWLVPKTILNHWKPYLDQPGQLRYICVKEYQQSTCIRWFSNCHFASNWN